jgi:hypothetical protein
MGCSDLKFLLIALLLLMSKTCLPPCWALEEQSAAKAGSVVLSDSQATEKVFEIDRAVVLECISLSRFNIRYHLEANRHWSTRDWLYPLWQELGTGASFANTIDDLNQRAKGLDKLDRISKSAQKGGLESAIVGSSLSGTSSAFELAQNVFFQIRARRLGFSNAAAIAYVHARLNSIDRSLEDRAHLVVLVSDLRKRQMLELEGTLLKRIRGQLLFEFKKWSVHSKEIAWREGTFYAVNAIQNYITCASSMMSLKGFSNPNYRGAAAISAVVADSLATINPPFRTAIGIYMRKIQRRRLVHSFRESSLGAREDSTVDWEQLKQLVERNLDPVKDVNDIEEITFLSERSRRLDLALDKESEKIDKFRRVAAQQAISGPAIGFASLVRSVLFTIAFYGYRHNPVTANQLSFAGRISQASGQSYSLIVTPTTAITGAIYKRRLSERGELPAQKFEERLRKLDEWEQRLKTSHPWTP